MTATVGQAVAALSAAYPPELAEPWDTGIGLTCGDPAAPLHAALFAVDVDEAVVTEAERLGAELLVTHHPLLFRAVQSVAADTAKGALIHRLLRSGIAHFAAHTNADKAVGGVNDALAAVVGVQDPRPLSPDPAGLLPVSSGQAGRTGLGRVGSLAQPMTLAEFVARLARLLPATVGGVRAAGDPDRVISVVAVCGGAGDSDMDAAAAAGADAYLTSDLRHHVVAEFVARAGAPAVVDVAHWAGEWPWLQRAAAVLRDAAAAGVLTGSVTTTVSLVRTDPWTIAAGSAPDGAGPTDAIAPTLPATTPTTSIEGPDTSAEG